jgi:ketosteroid isomerase-like protein
VNLRHPDQRVARIVERFESITPDSVAQLAGIYTAEASFKDPFNDVRGLPAIERIFAHMFVALEAPRFVVRDVVVQGDHCFLTWDFVFRFRRWRAGDQVAHGASHLVLAPDGRIAVHRDYWDAAEELYEKLPGIGGLMRWLKKRAAT